MTLPKPAVALIKDWVGKNPGKDCAGAERTALLKALKEVSPLLLPFPQCTRAHPPIPRSLQLLLQHKKPDEDERTDAQLKNTLSDQLKKIRERIIRPGSYGCKPKRALGEPSSYAPDARKKRSKAWREANPEYMPAYMPTWREENEDKIREAGVMRRQLAAMQNVLLINYK